MRSRNIKPAFYKNEQLAECSLQARYIFPGLWMLADRMGRLEYRPKRIKAELLPFDDGNVDHLLEELERYGLIKKYEVDGQEYIWIPTFLKHQNPHLDEQSSTIPPHPDDPNPEQFSRKDKAKRENAPCLHGASTIQEPSGNSTCTVQAPEKQHTSTVNARLNPESLNTESLNLKTSLWLKKAAPETAAAGGVCVSSGKKMPEREPGIDFLEIRQCYDKVRPEGENAGWAEYCKAVSDPSFPGYIALMADIDSRLESGYWHDDPRYRPSLAKYLNDRTWTAPKNELYKPTTSQRKRPRN